MRSPGSTHARPQRRLAQMVHHLQDRLSLHADSMGVRRIAALLPFIKENAMGCAFLPALLGMPRVAFVLVWFFQPGFIQRALEGVTLLVLLGFVFLPLTTLGFAYGMNSLGPPGEMTPLGWALTGISFAIDIGLVTGSRRNRAKNG